VTAWKSGAAAGKGGNREGKMIGRRKPLALGALLAGLALASAAHAQPLAEVDGASTAWVLSATALVLLMTLPGLALFYGGLVRSKNVLSVMMHCASIACLVSVLWLLGGYSLAFSGSGPVLGDLNRFGAAWVGASHVGRLPESVFFAFQMAFAIITPALIAGAYVERIRYSAVLLFSGLWLFLVYVPVCHWIWGGGWLSRLGVMDFAGGIVVHATAGVSALVVAARLGPRDGYPRDLSPPHNPAMTLMGAGLLWVGWYGFNGGSALAANATAGNALVATHLSAAAAALTWAAIERIRFGRASMIGLVTGAVAGLATVTPASGYVGALGGLALGVAGGGVCFLAVELVRHRWKIDDSLDVFAVHGVGGMLGSLLVAGLASPVLGGAGLAAGAGALKQLGVQALGVGVVCVWSLVMSAAIVWLCGKTVGLRANAEAIEDGLDYAAHGERAYTA
jgi:Amt family ammonium transporter